MIGAIQMKIACATARSALLKVGQETKHLDKQNVDTVHCYMEKKV